MLLGGPIRMVNINHGYRLEVKLIDVIDDMIHIRYILVAFYVMVDQYVGAK